MRDGDFDIDAIFRAFVYGCCFVGLSLIGLGYLIGWWVG